MPHSQFIFSETSPALPAGSCTWEAPSNIALVKYWGKHGLQLPKNPSLSFTLSACATQTNLVYTPKKQSDREIDFKVFFEGKPAKDFRPKIQTFFERIEAYLPFLKAYTFEIHTQNTFPHSSGIASSASGMAALSLCLMQMEARLNPDISSAYFYKKASFLARLGSGSAARSLSGPIMIWGKHPHIPKSSDDYAVDNTFELHKNFKNYQDTILIVDKGQKQVSSSVGHNLMKNHPFAESRFTQAYTNMERLLEHLKTGNLEGFIKLVESEALTLHAMMMTSAPYYLLMKPAGLEIIQRVWAYRQEKNSRLCFTLDAGTNVHLLYPESEKEEVLAFIENELSAFCQHGEFISDHLGRGPQQID